jgi:hypothetical protein
MTEGAIQNWQVFKIEHPAKADSILRLDDYRRILRHSSNWAYELRKSVRYDVRRGMAAPDIERALRQVLPDVLGPDQTGCILDLLNRLNQGDLE